MKCLFQYFAFFSGKFSVKWSKLLIKMDILVAITIKSRNYLQVANMK